MAKFTDYFKVVSPKTSVTSMTDSQNIGDQGTYANYTWYQRLIQGSASRITRYREYDLMDNDVEVARALDTIAEEMIGNDLSTELPLNLQIDTEKTETVNSSTVMTLRAALRYWCHLHKWHIRIFKLCRVAIKYGDCFFIRHSDTQKWEYIHPKNVVAALVDEHDMTKVVGWQIKKEIRAPNSPYNQAAGQYGTANENTVDYYSSQDVVWFSLNDDIGEMAPFGESVLRAVYRAQKQKELLEDAIIIYRIQRAPERRVFYIDVGKMPPNRVKTYLEQTKNEIRQRKIPTFGGGADQVDSTYNPQSMTEDFFFASRPEGKGSRVETLPGGAGLGEMADLEYFQSKVFRGLRIPLSYMEGMKPGGQGPIFNDGKIGTAYIEELRFALYIERLQSHIEEVLDVEFKRYLHAADIHIDTSIFEIKLPDPENFGKYRQLQLSSELLGTLSSAEAVPYISARFKLKKYAQFSDEELLLNERLLCEERGLNPDGGKENIPQIYGPAPEAGGGLPGGGMVAGLGPSGPGLPGGELGDDAGLEGAPDGDLSGTPGAGAPGAEPGLGAEQPPTL